jgi:hypothetical protein
VTTFSLQPTRASLKVTRALLAAMRGITSGDLVVTLSVASVPQSNNVVTGHEASVTSRDNVVAVTIASVLESNARVVGDNARVTSSVGGLPPTFARVTLTFDGIPAHETREPSGDAVRGKSVAIEGWREVNVTRYLAGGNERVEDATSTGDTDTWPVAVGRGFRPNRFPRLLAAVLRAASANGSFATAYLIRAAVYASPPTCVTVSSIFFSSNWIDSFIGNSDSKSCASCRKGIVNVGRIEVYGTAVKRWTFKAPAAH